MVDLQQDFAAKYEYHGLRWIFFQTQSPLAPQNKARAMKLQSSAAYRPAWQVQRSWSELMKKVTLDKVLTMMWPNVNFAILLEVIGHPMRLQWLIDSLFIDWITNAINKLAEICKNSDRSLCAHGGSSRSSTCCSIGGTCSDRGLWFSAGPRQTEWPCCLSLHAVSKHSDSQFASAINSPFAEAMQIWFGQKGSKWAQLKTYHMHVEAHTETVC